MSAARTILILVAAVIAEQSEASPNVALDDPVYEELAWLEALGRLPPYRSGFFPLSEARVGELLQRGAVVSDTWWISPLHRLRLRAGLFRDRVRPYSTLARPRNVVGGVAISCERNEGRPCGLGAATDAELESSAGYGSWVAGTIRVSALVGTDDYASRSNIDRAYVTGNLAFMSWEVGRDTLSMGPSLRSQTWSLHAPALDHIRVSTARPLHVGSLLELDAQYVLGRLRAPQRYPGTLVTIARAQARIASSLEVGVVQLLQLGGEGAPTLGFIDFVREHVQRRDASATETDSSNRRFGFDVSARISALQGLRIYYAITFEDIRRARWIDAVRYDADHLVGMELAAIGPGRRHGLTLEWQETGVRAQEHGPRATGFTNDGRVVGSPLGPDATSLYAVARVPVGRVTLRPWVEFARLRSDTYLFVDKGPINRTAEGVDEGRYRGGVDTRVSIRPNLWLGTALFLEHVEDLGFEPGARRNNVGVSASMLWYPQGPLGRIELD